MEDDSQVDMVRVYNTTPTVIAAEMNLWGTCDQYNDPEDPESWRIDCLCENAAFLPQPLPRVDFQPWVLQDNMNACNEHPPEPPGFFLGTEAPRPAPEGAWPNPFNGEIYFRFRARGSAGTLEVFDILGRKVTALRGRLLESGDQEFVWEGRDAEGTSVSSGVYLYRLTESSRAIQGKVVYVK